MSDYDDTADLDGIDGRGFVGWLIYSGAGTLVGSTPWSFTHGFYGAMEDINNPQPLPDFDNITQVMLAEYTDAMIPLLASAVVAGLAAAIVVFVARAGGRVGLWALLALGAILGGLTGIVFGGAEPDVVGFGAGCGLAAAGAMAVARKLVIRGG